MGKKGSFKKNHDVAYDILLVLFGVIIGCVISLAIGIVSNYQTDTYTAQQIYNNLNDFKQNYRWIPQFGHESIFYDVNNTAYTRIFFAKPNQPFITSMSIYPTIKYKLQNFDRRLSENITLYYDNLTKAESDRQELFNDQLPDFAIDEFRDDMTERLHYCWDQIPIIEKQLHENYGVQ